MSTALELLREVGGADAAVLDGVDRDADLQLAGLDSAVLIELTLVIEERYGAVLSADDLEQVRTLAGIDALLARVGSGG